MTAIRDSASTAAMGGRLSGRPRHERFLRSVTRLEAGEGRCLALFFGYAFLLLVAYYIVRTLREPLLLVDASAEVKAYASAVAALALLVLVPFYGAAFRRTDRNQLVRWVTGFFIATLGALYLAGRSGVDIGFTYYVWAGIFGVTIVAQFWAHAGRLLRRGNGAALVPGHHDGRDARRNRRPFGVWGTTQHARCPAADAGCDGVASADGALRELDAKQRPGRPPQLRRRVQRTDSR